MIALFFYIDGHFSLTRVTFSQVATFTSGLQNQHIYTQTLNTKMQTEINTAGNKLEIFSASNVLLALNTVQNCTSLYMHSAVFV